MVRVVAVASIALLAGCTCKAGDSSDDAAVAKPPVAPPADAKPRPSQLLLPQLPALELAAKPTRAQQAELGHRLFFDTRLSANNDRACYSCHQNDDGTGGHEPLAIGSRGKTLTRHAPVLWNVGYYERHKEPTTDAERADFARDPTAFEKGALGWDGRAPTLEDSAMAVWAGDHMGVGKDGLDRKAAAIAALPEYKARFAAAFPGVKITAAHVAQALAEYERTLICKDTAYDRFAGGDKTALAEPAQRGLDLFLGKGQCVVCHAPPHFSTSMGVDHGLYFNVGIGTAVAEDRVDIGRMQVSKAALDWAAFKAPTLRNVTRSAPYFHDGSVARLEDAVRLMATGGIPNKNKNPALVDRGMTADELADLVAFLGALECPDKLEAPSGKR